jgi:hypothetical protein
MNYLKELKVNWIDVRDRLRNKFAVLTDRDVCFVEGRHDEMLIRIQVILGKTSEEMNKLICEL